MEPIAQTSIPTPGPTVRLEYPESAWACPYERPMSAPPTACSGRAEQYPAMRETVMQRHHRDRDILWLTSGLPFLAWASGSETKESPMPRRSAVRPENQGAAFREGRATV